jgi:two-component sensor histidine kinase
MNEPMSVSHLTVVPSPEAQAAPETTAARIRRLQAEAQTLAREEVASLERRIGELAQAAKLIAEGGDAYPVGARELARRLAEELPRHGGVLEAILRKL